MTTLQRPQELTLTTTGAAAPDGDELTGRLASHVVANALVRKSVVDPVPFPVWWRVANAIPEVEAATAALVAAVDGLVIGPPVSIPVPDDGAGRALRHAQVLVARLVFSSGPTSPTLLHVRLARLRRALVAAG